MFTFNEKHTSHIFEMLKDIICPILIETLTNETNQIMEQIADIVFLPRLDDSEVQKRFNMPNEIGMKPFLNYMHLI